MVTADRKKFVKRSLLSYSRQTYNNTELIILDDGKEDLAPLLDDFPADRVKYLKIEKKPENVLGYLRNITLEESSGDFICQWDDDDWYHPDRIHTQVEILQQGYDACCLSSTLMHLDVEPFNNHPYISLFHDGTPGSNMHRRNDLIRYPALRRAEDNIYMKEWTQKRFTKLPKNYAHLFIRCFHGTNTWDMKHFLEQMRNTFPDLVAYGWYKFFRRDLFRHPRFNLSAKDHESFNMYLEDSYQSGLFRKGNTL